MGRPALPKNVHFLKGTDKKNPARMKAREGEPENVNPLGKPPKELSAEERKYWRVIEKESIEGVLGQADRVAVSLAAMLMAVAYSKEGATAGQMAQLIKLLGQFGMTPADRSKISVPGKQKKNPFDD